MPRLLIACLFIILLAYCFRCFEIKSSRNFCIKKLRLGYELAPAEDGDRVELRCGFCSPNNLTVSNNASGMKIAESRLWYRSDVQNRSYWREVTLGMLEPLTDNRVYVDIALQSLVIQEFTSEDSGLYRCRNLAGVEFAFYFLDGTKPNEMSMGSGKKLEWDEFKEQNLNPLKVLLAQFAKSYIPTVTVLWTTWSDCSSCDENGKGLRSKIARCRIAAPVSLKLLPYNLTSMSCASQWLNTSMSAQLQLPDFELKEFCDCDNDLNSTGIATRTKMVINNHDLEEGEDLNLVCPGTDKFTHVEWKKKGILVQRFNWTKLGNLARMRVDTANALRIEHAEKEVEDSFTCHVEGQTLARFIVKVKTTFVLVSDEYHQYRLYLLGVLGICLVMYFIYIGLLYREPRQTRDKIIGASKIV